MAQQNVADCKHLRSKLKQDSRIDIFFDFFLPHKKFCLHGFFLLFLCQDTQNYVKRPEKRFRKIVRMDMCVCVGVFVYVKGLKKFRNSGLRNYSAHRAEIWCALKANAALSLIPFSFKLIHGLGFYDDLNISKKSKIRDK